jgi:hypothetical protein
MNAHQKPDVEIQRRMIEQKRDQFRQAGFDAELEIATLKVQDVSGESEEDERGKMITTLKGKAENCYRSAEELSAMLARLPKPKKEKAEK